jgi:hypothetical protein
MLRVVEARKMTADHLLPLLHHQLLVPQLVRCHRATGFLVLLVGLLWVQLQITPLCWHKHIPLRIQLRTDIGFNLR